MKKILSTATLIAVTFALITSCKNHSPKENGHDHEEETAAKLQQHEEKHNSDDIILEPEVAERYGVKTSTIDSTSYNVPVRVTGQLLASPSDEMIVTATTTGVVTFGKAMMLGEHVGTGQQLATIKARTATGDNPNAQASAAIASAKRELDRLKPLLDDGIATIADYNAALAAYEAAKASYSQSAASGSVKSPCSGVVTELLATSGQFVETGTSLAKITKNTQLILRADLPESQQTKASSFQSAHVKLPSADEWIALENISGKRIDNADLPTLSGYTPIFFSLRNNGQLKAGSFVDVELTGASRSAGIIIPVKAIIEQQGSYYVFVKTGDHSYQRRRIEIGNKSGNEAEVTSGLHAGETLVTDGASALKMAETSGNIPEGHSHTH